MPSDEIPHHPMTYFHPMVNWPPQVSFFAWASLKILRRRTCSVIDHRPIIRDGQQVGSMGRQARARSICAATSPIRLHLAVAVMGHSWTRMPILTLSTIRLPLCARVAQMRMISSKIVTRVSFRLIQLSFDQSSPRQNSEAAKK